MRKEKIPSEDYQKTSLPHNRKELFFDLLKNQWRLIISVSLLLTLFILPLFADYLVFSLLIAGAYKSGASNQQIFSLFFYACLIALPCIWLLHIGLAASFRISRKLSFGEGVIANADFFYGLKENWKGGLLMGSLCSLSSFLALAGSFYLVLFISAQPVLLGLGIGVLALQFILIHIAAFYFYLQNVIYDNKFAASLKNAFIFTFLRLPVNFLLFIAFPGLIVALFCINDITAYVGMGLFVLGSFGAVLGWSLYIERTLDCFINRLYYPEFVNKGLMKEEDKDHVQSQS